MRSFNKVGLVCTSQVDLGMRTISGQLQSRGVETVCFFLDSTSSTYSDAIVEDVKEKLGDAAVVGFSLIEIGKDRAIFLSQKLREAGIKVVWGGAYPTLAPLEALKYADYICVGEGDDTMPALVECLANDSGVEGVPNLVYQTADGEIRQNPLSPLKRNLDDLPYPDYFTPGHHYDLDKSGRVRVVENGYPRMERSTIRFGRTLWTMFGRGCYLKCSYCSVPTIKEKCNGKRPFLRFKSPEVMVDEIEHALKQVGGADYIYIFANDFCAQSLQKIEEFSERYRQRIGLPFFCYATPLSLTKEKAKALLSAGAERLDFGIQSGSDRILEIYGRAPAGKEKILSAAKALAEAINEADNERACAWKLRPYFDIIFNAPFETKEDLVQTIDVIKKIGDMGFDFGLYCQPLTFFQNTKLYEQAQNGELGAIDFDFEESLAKLSYQQIAEHISMRGKHIYLNTLIYWMRYDHTAYRAGIVPRVLLPVLIRPKVVDFFDGVNDKAAFRMAAGFINRIMPTRDRRFFLARKARAFLHASKSP